jgi:hypothetical protein
MQAGECVNGDGRSWLGSALVTLGAACPRDQLGRPRSLVRAGDLLRVSCPSIDAEVTYADQYSVSIRWPWRQLDPDSRFAWNGDLAFELDPQRPGSLFATTPRLVTLRAGDRCQVGITAQVVQVVSVRRWWPDQDTGWLPRRPLALSVLPQGTPPDLTREGILLDPYGAEPITVELLLRPFAFLDDLDVVMDRQGRRWEFATPYWWVELDRDDQQRGLPPPLPGPAWPLSLLTSRGRASPDRVRAGQVAEATARGDHAGHLAGWSRLAGANPVSAEQQHLPVLQGQPFLDEEEERTVRAQARAGLHGLSFTPILRRFVHTWQERLRLIWDGDDLQLGPGVERLELKLDELAGALRQMRSSGAARWSG